MLYSDFAAAHDRVAKPLDVRLDAVQIAGALAATGESWCWLDGDRAPAGETSESYFGLASVTRECARGAEAEFLASLESVVDSKAEATHGPSIRRGFTSGWVTALSYEFGVALMGIDPAEDNAAPAFALRLDAVLVLRGEHLEVRGRDAAAVEAWHERYERLFAAAARPIEAEAAPGPAKATQSPDPELAQLATTWRKSADEYEARVSDAQRAIARGDAYVLCLTDQASVAGGASEMGSAIDAVELYATLRQSGAPIRGGVLSLAAGGAREQRALVSASPERFLSVRGREVETRPIKGTRPRSNDAIKDEALASELASDPKERAENLMIVDLMRNDLSRVSEVGSVRVSEFLRVERHPHVHQLVSCVTGTLLPDATIAELVAATFPGGSMTGAPKRRAVELLAGFEGGPRGLYSGCFGWIDDSGDAELAMTIRSVELRGAGERMLIGAGGGITADSVPVAEREEKDLKAASLLAALGAAL